MKKYQTDLQGQGSPKSQLKKEFNPINSDSISGNSKSISSIDSGVLFGYAEQFPTTLDIE